MEVIVRKLFLGIPLLAALIAIGAIQALAHDERKAVHQVVVPQEDRFTPFAVTIRAGDSVRWVNNDADDHTVVSDDAFNTAGHQGTNQLLASGHAIVLRFNHPGTFVYYCRFHAHLDSANQPVAPGPEGGIQDANGNFGTPMSGVVTVLKHGSD